MTVDRRRGWMAAAGLWSLAYGCAGLHWAAGGAGFPYGDAEAASMLSWFAGARADDGGPVVACAGLAGALAALAMLKIPPRPPVRGVLQAVGWTFVLALVVVVPDVRLLRDLAYLCIGGWDIIGVASANQLYCVVGGVLWARATLAYRRLGAGASRSAGRDDGAPRAWDGRRLRDAAARWGRWAVYAAIAASLPWAVIRLCWFAGIPLGLDHPFSWGAADPGPVKYVFASLPIGGALLTLGLIQRWGEVFPRWLPLVGGRRVPPALATVPATFVGLAVTSAGTKLFARVAAELISGRFDYANWGTHLPAFFFLPWGVSLGLATLAYHVRRTACA